MKTMQDYSCYCTEEQTRKAYELDAPLEKFDPDNSNGVICKDGKPYAIPTTQQMIGWLEKEKNFGFSRNVGKYIVRYSVSHIGDEEYGLDSYYIGRSYSSELAAIDAALDYLEKGGIK